MGWCSATEIFDVVTEAILEERPKEEIIEVLMDILEQHDWDCHSDSDHWDNPIVRKIFKEHHPHWFEDE